MTMATTDGSTMKLRLALSTLALATCLALAGGASAQDRAIVLEFSGPGSGATRQAVVDAIEQGGWQVVSESELAGASARTGADPASTEVAAEVGAAAVVDGRVSRRGRRFSLRTTVRDASSGAVLSEDSFRGRNAQGLRSDVRRDFFDRAGGAMAGGSVPSAAASGATRAVPRAQPEAAPVREDAFDGDDGADDEVRASSGAVGPALTPLWVAVGVSGFSRDFSYTDDLFLALRPYQLPIGWAARAQARWYPAAHFTQDFAANIGLDVSFGAALGLRSRQRDGTTFGTDSLDFRAGADVRIPIDAVELGIGFGYGIHTYSLGVAEDGNTAQLPNVEYNFLRPAIRARIEVGAGIYTDASFGWRVLTGTGALGSSEWFPRNSGSGFDLGAWLGWESDMGLGVRAGFEMQRYFFSMNPEPGDTHIAGGAADQFLAGSFDLVYRMH